MTSKRLQKVDQKKHETPVTRAKKRCRAVWKIFDTNKGSAQSKNWGHGRSQVPFCGRARFWFRDWDSVKLNPVCFVFNWPRRDECKWTRGLVWLEPCWSMEVRVSFDTQVCPSALLTVARSERKRESMVEATVSVYGHFSQKGKKRTRSYVFVRFCW